MNVLPIDPLLAKPAPLICFSHLRWDFVLQRPQHLMSRFAQERPVWFWEEMIPTDHHLAYLEFHAFEGTSVQAIRPRVPARLSAEEAAQALSGLLDQLLAITGAHQPVLWFYTPQMWPIARHLRPAAVVYDCMDELSNFRFAPPDLQRNEAALLAAADVVFTGGYSLYEAKRHQHGNIHPFPSAVEAEHFGAARAMRCDPADQAGIPHPRLGYYGVIDERLDLDLLRDVAAARPDWHIVMVGPVAKLAPGDLPRAANIHWLGQKGYGELPAYLSGWDVALMPFAINEATRFISPTKTPEYLAGGRQVVSTPVRDVVRHYGDVEAVRIADDAAGFVQACEAALATGPGPWLDKVDRVLAEMSWDSTFAHMKRLLDGAQLVPLRAGVSG
ncbi:glycosyltransferase family 1 protein [Falsirhodobacter sp. 20TX0035]|uniref:glycosyltransferase family 1 protein n=1 Tax=Falsirhodobacter sp. 20TX0035 TaxID=3022019 RepID=UPI00232C1AFD|nr:glycosyltransferase family 1 protein [Falsirhodobacter sp. 20TX0035]MDB6452901.1 glycosyltransferase family 1 protein [Falsirhodobacter sp. 20TX0035]